MLASAALPQYPLFLSKFTVKWYTNNAIELPSAEFIRKRRKNMADRGSKDKGTKETRKKPKLNPKEKRKLKNEKKNPKPTI